MIDEALRTFQDLAARGWIAVLTDIVDIGVVAFLIYRVLLLVRGTRAAHTAVGLLLIFVVYQAAHRLGLVTLWTMLDSVLTYAVLIIVVLFQNDIRRALTRVGRRSWLLRPRYMTQEQGIEAIVAAISSLKQKRIGALVVIERDATLGEFVEPGVVLDAEISRELLYTLFVPSFENPLHDGAVIIRDGRIWQAGAFLPLSTRRDLERSFGTRHRAAIGLSEETDAVVVVLGEERASISLCFSGNIVRDLDETALQRALIGMLAPALKKTLRQPLRSVAH